MLEDDRKRVYQMIREVGSTPGIELIRLINKDGDIIFSTKEIEIGQPLNKEIDHACKMCHTGEVTLTHASSMNRSRVFRNGGGEDVLGMVRAIYNQDSCATAACHAKDGQPPGSPPSRPHQGAGPGGVAEDRDGPPR